MMAHHDNSVFCRTRRSAAIFGCAALAFIAMASCGSDKEATEAPATAAPATAAPATEAPTTDAPATDAPATDAPTTDAPADTAAIASDLTEVCALATELSQQNGLPTAEQLSKYQTLAPAEIKDAVDTAGAPLIAAGSDPVKFYIAVADDAVQAAIYRIDAWETTNCGVGHPDDSLAGNATRDHEDGAAVVKVTATDYQFAFDTNTIASGRTSFVLTNNGQEAHMMVLFKMAAGVTMDQLLKSDTGGEGLIDGSWGSNVAAPGGGDEEVITLDLVPGHYGIACFVAGADGTPHAMTGMTKEFTVP